jgi:hypothetical protein
MRHRAGLIASLTRPWRKIRFVHGFRRAAT